jgi:UDP-glucose 4-epimerase
VHVVVIGATGNVGTSVLAALERDASIERVTAVARRPAQLGGAKVTWVEGDVTTDAALPLEGADAVVYLVGRIEPAERPAELAKVNVEGVERVASAAVAAGVGALVFASSTAAYARAPKEHPVDESWELGGESSSPYARQKAEAERALDAFAAREPELRVARLRFDAVFKREAGAQARETFLGRIPRRLLRPDLIPFVPDVPELRFQAVHADDLGEAFRLAVVEDAHGAYNVAADPVLDAHALARAFGARVVPGVPGSVRALRTALAAAHRVGLSPLSATWLDFVTEMPLIDSSRIRDELGWQPRHRADEALLELVAGMREGAAGETAALGR